MKNADFCHNFYFDTDFYGALTQENFTKAVKIFTQ